jgi:hypothetical protein
VNRGGRPRAVDKFVAQRIWLPSATWEKARRAAEGRGMPVSAWIRRIIENALLRVPDE